MKISALRLHNVKRFAGRGVALEGIGDGVNVLCAANEFGKSTSFEALHALFFQLHSSTTGEVRNLRPYAGGSPLVEADIETPAGRYRITKQFYGRGAARVTELAGGRLVAQADEAENFIAGLVRGGTAGPAGLLWVRQGVTGMEKRSRSDEEGEYKVRSTLLQSVQGEVEAITGGRRMDEILSTVESQIEALVTKRGPKAGSSYAAALEQRDKLETEERKLGAEVAALREALDRRAAANRRIAELDRVDDRDARRAAISAAQAVYDGARTQAETRRAAEAELKLARDRRAAAAAELATYRQALDDAAQVTARRAEAERTANEAIARRDAAAAATLAARSEGESAEAAEREATDLLARLDAALKAREAAERLAQLERQLADAEAARAAQEQAEAALAILRIPDKSIAELEKLGIEIARLGALAEAARPTVQIAYAPGAAAVAFDGIALSDGEPRAYDGQARLDIPGIGIVTLRAGESRGSDGRLAEAQERHRTLLASMGVADLAAARERQRDAQRKEGDLRELGARLSVLAPEGLPALRQELARRREAADDTLEIKGDPEPVRAAQAQALARRVAARAALRTAEPAQAAAGDAVAAARADIATLDARQAQLDAALGPGAARGEREQALAERLADRDADVRAQESTLATLVAGAVDLASAEAALRRLQSVDEAVRKELGRLGEEVAGLAAQIATRSDDAVEESWRETGEKLAAARSRAAGFEKEVAVLRRLRGALEAARSNARETYLKPVMTELKPLLGLLFDDAKIEFDEKTLLPHTITRNGQQEDVDRLSGGMREQLSVLTRLAFARLLARDGRPAPVILDDALVYSDDDRIEKMFDALHRQSRDQQIIVFSCRQRAFQRLGGNVLTMTDWTPDL